MHDKAPRGYAGLVALLITVAIIGFLVWRPDILSPKPSPEVENAAVPLQGSTQIEHGINAVGAAQEAKQRIERSSAQQQEAIDN